MKTTINYFVCGYINSRQNLTNKDVNFIIIDIKFLGRLWWNFIKAFKANKFNTFTVDMVSFSCVTAD